MRWDDINNNDMGEEILSAHKSQPKQNDLEAYFQTLQ